MASRSRPWPPSHVDLDSFLHSKSGTPAPCRALNSLRWWCKQGQLSWELSHSSPPPQPDPGRPASSKPSWWSHLWYPTSRRRSRGCMPPARNAGRPCWGHGLLHLVCSGIGTSLAALLDGWPKVRCIAAAQKESSAVWEKGLHSASLPFSQQDGLGLNTYWRPTTSYLLPFELRQVFALIALAVLGHCRRWRLSREKSSWGRSSNQTLWRAIRGEGWPRQ